MTLKNKSKKETIHVLDLFAGAGGFSEGFFDIGCELVGHIEMDEQACETIRTRVVYHALKKIGKLADYRKYLLGVVTRDELVKRYHLENQIDSVIHEKIDNETYKPLIKRIKNRLAGKPLDVIIGGPPCQAYSYIGRARDKNRMQSDERNYLYQYYVEFLKALKPKMFIFENVPGLLTAGGGKYLEDMRRLMKKVGYDTDFKILNAADYGVPQNRSRVILIGWNKTSSMSHYPDIKKITRSYKVKDFLNDLPSLQAGEVFPTSVKKSSKILEKLKISNLKGNIIQDHITRPHNKQDKEIYRIAVSKKNKGVGLKYASLPKRLKTHANETSFIDRFKVVDGNAHASHTVVAHIAKDGHHYIHPDIIQNRSLSIREAARLQTFPDNFKFEGSRLARFKQIGNAVPPMLSIKLAKELTRYL